MNQRMTIVCLIVGAALVVVPMWTRDSPRRVAVESTAGPTEMAPDPTVQSGPERPLEEPQVSRARDTSSTSRTTTSTTALVTTSTTSRPVDRDESDFPLIQYLPAENPGWKIDYHVEGPRLVLTITLMPVLNQASDAATRRSQLTALKADVLAWLTAKGAPVGTYGVMWRPSEAAGL